jgi:predicted nuclease of predicted toxin-antitoxin system
LVTRDRDFGSLVFLQGLGAGVIYLRMLPSTQHAVHKELQRVLETYTEADLQSAFVVVEPGRHRFRRISQQD